MKISLSKEEVEKLRQWGEYLSQFGFDGTNLDDVAVEAMRRFCSANALYNLSSLFKKMITTTMTGASLLFRKYAKELKTRMYDAE